MASRICLSLLLLVATYIGSAQPPKTTASSSESLGISSQAILNFIEAAEKEQKDALHSFILLRHGKLAAQGWWNPYSPETPHMLFSLSKSFTSTAIGIAQSEGLLNVNDRVISFFPNEAPVDSLASQNLKAMRIRDLLAMNTGHNDDATGPMRADTANWVKGFFSLPVQHKPGTHFVYNSAATFMLSAIIQKVTGKTLLEYLTPRLFEPLGIKNPTWENAPGGINTGGWGLKIRTADIANLGQLYLQKGNWNGKQLIPAEWVAEATKKQTSNGSNPDSDWEQGYGYQFWMCRYGLYRGDGAFGQYCIVFPKQDAVLAITSGTSDMGAIMNLVWKHLLPAFEDKPLPENANASAALETKLKTLAMSRVQVASGNKKPKGLTKQTYTVPANDEGISELSFDFTGKNPALTLSLRGKPFTVEIGNSDFKNSVYLLPNGESTPVAASGGWVAPDTLQFRMYLYETPFNFIYNIRFDKDEAYLSRLSNVEMGPNTKVEMKLVKK